VPTDRVLGISFLCCAEPVDHDELSTAVLQLYEQCDLRPDRIHASDWDQATVFCEETFRAAVIDKRNRSVWLWFELVPEITLYLRSLDPTDRPFENRFGALISARLPVAITEPVRRFLHAIARLYPLSQGSVAGYRTLADAGQECCRSGAFGGNEITRETRLRLKADKLGPRKMHDYLRRLYPVTIIGPEIWSQLPPMPAFDPMPTIEDLGDCKMLTCWPELVEPRDPAFLAGTKELRKWLWPYTIQNPADAVELDPPVPQT
jgi:hypothetical protein